MSHVVLKDVSFSYDEKLQKRRPKGGSTEILPDEKLTLKHLNLEIEAGEFVCLVGHSGCGKSTTLRMLAGLQKPTSGEILIGGLPVDGPGLDRSVVFQSYALFPWMTALENVEFGIKQALTERERKPNKTQIRDTALTYLEKVGMSGAAEKKPCHLSGGMQQRVAIARALAMDADMMLFDEPFGALDVKTRRELQLLMENLWVSGDRVRSALFVTHDIEEALLLADRVVFMSGGRFLDAFALTAPRPRELGAFRKSDEYRKAKEGLMTLFEHASESGDDDQESLSEEWDYE